MNAMNERTTLDALAPDERPGPRQEQLRAWLRSEQEKFAREYEQRGWQDAAEDFGPQGPLTPRLLEFLARLCASDDGLFLPPPLAEWSTDDTIFFEGHFAWLQRRLDEWERREGAVERDAYLRAWAMRV